VDLLLGLGLWQAKVLVLASLVEGEEDGVTGFSSLSRRIGVGQEAVLGAVWAKGVWWCEERYGGVWLLSDCIEVYFSLCFDGVLCLCRCQVDPGTALQMGVQMGLRSARRTRGPLLLC
jgi:hypothetical protein